MSAKKLDEDSHMDASLVMLFQNAHEGMSDEEFYRNELRLAEGRVPLGFDSLWSVKHHFFDYALYPDNLQFLSCVADAEARRHGTVILPLEPGDQCRREGRHARLHLRRPRALRHRPRARSARIRRIWDRHERGARALRTRAARMIVAALDKGYMEGSGPYYPQARREIRRRPSLSFRDHMYPFVAMSAASVPICAPRSARV